MLNSIRLAEVYPTVALERPSVPLVLDPEEVLVNFALPLLPVV